MENLARFAWRLTIIIFTIVFFYIYAYLDSKVGYDYNEYGKITASISKDQYFYVGITVFMLINILLWSIGKVWLIERKGDNEWSVDFKEKLRAWMLGFAAVVNVFAITILTYLLFINFNDGMLAIRYGSIVYLGIALIVGWAGLLFFILLHKVNSYKSN
jgi:magnesium-transporting ATPase (P-type)